MSANPFTVWTTKRPIYYLDRHNEPYDKKLVWVLIYMCKHDMMDQNNWICECGLGYGPWEDIGECHTSPLSHPFGNKHYKVT